MEKTTGEKISLISQTQKIARDGLQPHESLRPQVHAQMIRKDEIKSAQVRQKRQQNISFLTQLNDPKHT